MKLTTFASLRLCLLVAVLIALALGLGCSRRLVVATSEVKCTCKSCCPCKPPSSVVIQQLQQAVGDLQQRVKDLEAKQAPEPAAAQGVQRTEVPHLGVVDRY